jgi:hypothetical protein
MGALRRVHSVVTTVPTVLQALNVVLVVVRYPGRCVALMANGALLGMNV